MKKLIAITLLITGCQTKPVPPSKLVKQPSDLRQEAAAMIRDGSMPSLETLLQAVADVRERYSDEFKASRKKRKQKSLHSTTRGV